MSDSVSQGNETHKLDPTLDFFAGTAAGVSGITVGFPFDTVKYRFQNPSSNVQYRSTFHALASITREERLRGLFKGISSPLATAPLLNGLLFATYRFLIKFQMWHDDQTPDDQQPTLGQVFLAGGGCGLASTLLTTPIELIKIQQQKQQQHLSTPKTGRIPTARAVALHIYRTAGVRGLYRGFGATMLRDVGGFGLYFSGYEGTLRLFAPAPTPARPAQHADPVLDEVADTLSRPLGWAPLLLAGGAAGIIGWLGTFPFDVLKTRMQAQAQTPDVDARHRAAARAGTSSSSWRAARELYAEAGARGFWRGLAPTIVRAVPVNMAVFGTFESVVWAFS
ncbi:mitochondrial carrier domain-containing protein [Russula dissimulans]|nr:mitochondrial carrier domain-containing protein [Russula dissimulans]